MLRFRPVLSHPAKSTWAFHELIELTEKPFPCQEKTLSLPFSMLHSLPRLLLCQPCHSSGTWASSKGSQQQTLGQIDSLKWDCWQENEQRCQSKENILSCAKGSSGVTARLAQPGMELKPRHTFPIEWLRLNCTRLPRSPECQREPIFYVINSLKIQKGTQVPAAEPWNASQVLSQDSWTRVTQQMQFKHSFSARSLSLPTTRHSFEAQNDPISLLPSSNAIPFYKEGYEDVGASLREVSQCSVSDISSSAAAQQECVGREEASVPPSPVSLWFQQCLGC